MWGERVLPKTAENERPNWSAVGPEPVEGPVGTALHNAGPSTGSGPTVEGAELSVVGYWVSISSVKIFPSRKNFRSGYHNTRRPPASV